jgi:uncharacterized phage protein gp47/JayE
MVSFARPTMPELLTRVAGDIASRTEGHAFVRRTVEAALGFACAGLAYTLHGHLDWVRRQLFPHTADAEALSEWGDWLEVPRKAGARASGSVRIAGTGTLPVGTLYTDAAGLLYRVMSESGYKTYGVEAIETGEAQNLGTGEPLTLVSPVPGVEPVGLVDYPLSGGATVEDLEAWRPRVIEAMRTPLPSGAPGDYRRWALSREGVTEAWEFPRRMGAGTVSVGFVMGGRYDIIPTVDDVAAMQSYLDSVRPADMRAVYVVAPIRDALRLSVTARGSMSEQAMTDAVRTLLTTDAALEQPLSVSLLDEALSAVPGELSHTITRIEAEARGTTRVIPPDAGEIVPVTWGLLTLDTLTLTVVP